MKNPPYAVMQSLVAVVFQNKAIRLIGKYGRGTDSFELLFWKA